MSREVIDINRYIDQTLLKPTITSDQLSQFCEEALEYDFRSVCIPPSYVKQAERILLSSTTSVCTVIGFPLGYSDTKVKLFEVKKAMDDGAEELDIVINQSWLKSENMDQISDEMNALNQYVHSQYGLVKWIVETSNLSKEELMLTCDLCRDSNADFIKTSTGFAGSGAKLADVKLWKKAIGKDQLKIKASGGIKNSKDALSFIAAGASRIGCSSGVQIIKEYNHG